MTSKHSFFKCMKEDLRHRVWMIALSVLGNFLAILVAFLIAEDDIFRNYAGDLEKYSVTYIGSIVSFFKDVLTGFGGTIALIGAVIVGLWGFRFLFSKKMVDTYHSLPIKRNTLFWVYYLDGILIWLVPYLTSLLITLIIAVVKMVPIGGWESCGLILQTAGMTTLVLVVGFLLMYHLVLVAVMLSGNVFNTIVTGAILGCAVLCIYGLGVVFFEYYMETFYVTNQWGEAVIYTSPLVSAIYMLVAYCQGDPTFSFATTLNVNFIVMLLLGVVAWRLYCKRASELAEQGVKNKIATTVMKLIASVLGGMGGWLVFILITSTNSVGWGIFGCILVSVLVYGVLDIIFHMDFKAFLANKVWMLASTVVSLALCLAFNMDWFGYDEYLPKQEQIKSLAIYTSDYSNHHNSSDENGNSLATMEYQDQDIIYKFLSAGVDNLDYYYSEYEGTDIYYGNTFDYVTVKVTLNSGRSYYRQYKMFAKDEEVFRPIVLSEEYAESALIIDEEQREQIYRVSIRTENTYIEEEEKRREVLDDLITAYNQDVMENPERVILGEGRLMVQLRMYNTGYNNYYLDIYESMEHTMAALDKHGYGKAVGEIPYEKVDSIILSIGVDYNKYELGEDFVSDYELMARERFGVWDEESLERYRQYQNDIQEKRESYYAEITQVKSYAADEEMEEITITITDPAEIAELMPLIHYDSAYYDSGMLKKHFVGGVTLMDTNEGRWDLYLQEGDLPLKYIERFGDLQK